MSLAVEALRGAPRRSPGCRASPARRRARVDHPLGVFGDRDVAELRQRGAARGGDLLHQGLDAAPGLVGGPDDFLAAV